jgi:hypothetical protein
MRDTSYSACARPSLPPFCFICPRIPADIAGVISLLIDVLSKDGCVLGYITSHRNPCCKGSGISAIAGRDHVRHVTHLFFCDLS